MPQHKNTRQRIKDFLSPVLQPTGEHDTLRWQRGLYILLGIEVVRYAYRFVSSLGSFYWQGYDYDALVMVVFLLLAGYMMHHRHRWGWVLLFAYGLLTVTTALTNVLVLLLTDARHQHIPYYLLAVFIYSAVTSFFWKKETTAFFGVSKKLKKRTLIVTLLLAALLVAGELADQFLVYE